MDNSQTSNLGVCPKTILDYLIKGLEEVDVVYEHYLKVKAKKMEEDEQKVGAEMIKEIAKLFWMGYPGSAPKQNSHEICALALRSRWKRGLLTKGWRGNLKTRDRAESSCGVCLNENSHRFFQSQSNFNYSQF